MKKRDTVWDRWNEIDPLLATILDLDPKVWDTFLDERCAGDPELRGIMEELLQYVSDSEEGLSVPGGDLLREALATGREEARERAERRVGTSLGPYRLDRVLGIGGMGTVYLGEREDGLFERSVAIKVLRLSLDTPGVVERFSLERRILASLTHSGIAQMLDGGVTEDGRPFLVMEYVEGEPIDRYADNRRLGVEDRVWLALAVADAVDYAHRKLVVHRDLKPANILVTPEGRVKLLDFGVAKLLDADQGTTGATTRADVRFLTPEYAAPEQVRAEPVTTATDVHAVGALLFELLTGRRPFWAASGSPFDMQRAVLEQTPLPPSTEVLRARPETTNEKSPEDLAHFRAATPRRLRRELSGDLDAIVSKALRKKPEDRYGSVRELQADLGRHLTGRPVAAREGLWAYRARKFVVRHWLPVGAAAVLVLLLSGFTLALARAQAITLRERDRAEKEARNAELVVDFLADVFRGRDPDQAPSDTVTARELVEWGVERVDQEFDGQPEIQADLLLVLGSAWGNLGLVDDGLPLMGRALDIRKHIFGEQSEEVAEALLEMAALLRGSQRPGEGLQYAEEALSLRRELHPPGDVRLADALTATGWALVGHDRPDSALVFFQDALRIRQQHPEDILNLETTRLALAFGLRNAGRLDEAEQIYEEAIPRFRDLPEAQPVEVATYLNNLGYLRRRRGDFAGAEELYREALAILNEQYGPGHPRSLNTSGNLAAALMEQGRTAETGEVLEARVAAAEAQWPEGHWLVTAARRAVADFLLRTGRLAEAEPLQRAVAEDLAARFGPQHNQTSFAYARIAVIRLLEGDTVPGKTFLNRLHSWMAEQRDAAGGRLLPQDYNLVDQFVILLEDTGPPEELERFSALLQDTSGS